MIELDDASKAILDRPNFAHLATLQPAGEPHVDPVWVGREGNLILIGTGEGTVKVRNARRDARVALSICDFDNPYEELQLRGRIVEIRPDRELSGMDPISVKYIGTPFPLRDPAGRVVLVMEPDWARYTSLPFKHTPPGRT